MLEQTRFEEFENLLELHLDYALLVALHECQSEPEDGLDAFGKDEVEYCRDELKREAIRQ